MEQFIANSLEVVLYGEHEAKLSSFANSTLPASLHPLRSTEISKRSPIIVIERDTLPGVSTAGYVISAQGLDCSQRSDHERSPSETGTGLQDLNISRGSTETPYPKRNCSIRTIASVNASQHDRA